MIIPAISVFFDDAVCAGSVSVKDWTIRSAGCNDLKDIVRNIVDTNGAGMPIVMIDIDGIDNGKISIDLLRKIRLRKAEVWIMTYVENVDDVFDVFSMDADMLLIPMHTLSSIDELKEIDSVSDRYIPCLFTDGRSAMLKNGKEDLLKTIREIKRTSQRMIVFPTRSISDETWDIISGTGGIIPVAYDDIQYLKTKGFEDIISLDLPAGSSQARNL